MLLNALRFALSCQKPKPAKLRSTSTTSSTTKQPAAARHIQLGSRRRLGARRRTYLLCSFFQPPKESPRPNSGHISIISCAAPTQPRVNAFPRVRSSLRAMARPTTSAISHIHTHLGALSSSFGTTATARCPESSRMLFWPPPVIRQPVWPQIPQRLECRSSGPTSNGTPCNDIS